MFLILSRLFSMLPNTFREDLGVRSGVLAHSSAEGTRYLKTKKHYKYMSISF